MQFSNSKSALVLRPAPVNLEIDQALNEAHANDNGKRTRPTSHGDLSDNDSSGDETIFDRAEACVNRRKRGCVREREDTEVLTDCSATSTFERIPSKPGNAIYILAKGCGFEISRSALDETPGLQFLLSNESASSPYLLEKDDPGALKILLNILHNKPRCLPLFRSTRELYELATLCEKYGLEEHVALYAKEYMEPLWRQGHRPHDRDWMAWLWIFAIFIKHPTFWERFHYVLDVVAANMCKEEGKWVFAKHTGTTIWSIPISKVADHSGLENSEGTLLYRRDILLAEFYRLEKDGPRSGERSPLVTTSEKMDTHWDTQLAPGESLIAKICKLEASCEDTHKALNAKMKNTRLRLEA